MAGLDVTDELKQAEVAALVRELQSYEARVIAGDESYEGRVALVREQLQARGALAEKPQKRAQTRGSESIKRETR